MAIGQRQWARVRVRETAIVLKVLCSVYSICSPWTFLYFFFFFNVFPRCATFLKKTKKELTLLAHRWPHVSSVPNCSRLVSTHYLLRLHAHCCHPHSYSLSLAVEVFNAASVLFPLYLLLSPSPLPRSIALTCLHTPDQRRFAKGKIYITSSWVVHLFLRCGVLKESPRVDRRKIMKIKSGVCLCASEWIKE